MIVGQTGVWGLVWGFRKTPKKLLLWGGASELSPFLKVFTFKVAELIYQRVYHFFTELWNRNKRSVEILTSAESCTSKGGENEWFLKLLLFVSLFWKAFDENLARKTLKSEAFLASEPGQRIAFVKCWGHFGCGSLRGLILPSTGSLLRNWKLG